MATAQNSLVAGIEHAIDGVLDPCSRFNGTWISFVELGMVDAIEVREGGNVLIKLLLDDPTCVYLYEIQKEVREAALAVPGVEQVEIEVVYDRVWTEELLSDAGREKLRVSRERTRTRLLQVASLRSASAQQ